MLIDTKYRKGVGWEINENDALLVFEFRNVLENKQMGVPAMAFIAMYADPSSIFADIEEDKDRKQKALNSVFGNKHPKYIDDKLIVDAIAEYGRMTNTTANKIRKSYTKGAEKLSTFLENEVIKTPASAKNYSDVLGDMPDHINNLEKIKEDTRRDGVGKIGKVKGQRELTYSEKKQRGG